MLLKQRFHKNFLFWENQLPAAWRGRRRDKYIFAAAAS
jgi:hypothetical protein